MNEWNAGEQFEGDRGDNQNQCMILDWILDKNNNNKNKTAMKDILELLKDI